LVEESKFGHMVCYDPPNIGEIPISQAIDRISVVDPSGSAVMAARALGISFGDTAGYSNPFPKSQVTAETAAERYNIYDGSYPWPFS
jgi:6-phosphofructokinase 1